MAQAENAREAWLFAIRRGIPLNTFITVHWNHAPAKATGLHPVDRNGLLRDGLKAWVYRNAPGVPFAWIEVREKARGVGEHVHLVAHVPDHLRERFAKAVDRLVARQSASVSPTAVDVRPVGPKWWERHAYLMKAGTDEVRQRYDVPDRWSRSHRSMSKGALGVVLNVLALLALFAGWVAASAFLGLIMEGEATRGALAAGLPIAAGVWVWREVKLAGQLRALRARVGGSGEASGKMDRF